MKIEVGDIINTSRRRIEVLTVLQDSVIVRDIEFREMGKESYVLPAVISLCSNKIWRLEKKIKNLDMSVVEEL